MKRKLYRETRFAMFQNSNGISFDKLRFDYLLITSDVKFGKKNLSNVIKAINNKDAI